MCDLTYAVLVGPLDAEQREQLDRALFGAPIVDGPDADLRRALGV